MTLPIRPEAEEFQRLTDFGAKKQIVHGYEVRIQEGRFNLNDDERVTCATSPFDLDRIVLYLTEEHGAAPPKYRARLMRVEHEEQRLRANAYEGSLMPLSYALGSFLGMLKSRPHLVDEARADSRMFRELRTDIERYDHLDRGGQVRRDVDDILARLGASAGEARKTKRRGRTKAVLKAFLKFWTTIPGILTGAAAVITAIAGVIYGPVRKNGQHDRPSRPSLTFVEGADSALFGNDAGGTEFLVSCGPRQAIRGFKGTEAPGRAIYMLIARCGELGVSEERPGGHYDVVVTPSNDTEMRGGGGISQFHRDCPAGAVVARVELRKSRFGNGIEYVDGITATCRRYEILRDGAGFRIASSVAATLEPFGSGAPTKERLDFACPENGAINRISGRTGATMDALRFGCTSLEPGH